MYTTTDIISTTTGTVYAPAMVWVEIVSIRDQVAICQWNNNRFPCHISLLTEHPTEAPPRPQPQPQPKPKRRRR